MSYPQHVRSISLTHPTCIIRTFWPREESLHPDHSRTDREFNTCSNPRAYSDPGTCSDGSAHSALVDSQPPAAQARAYSEERPRSTVSFFHCTASERSQWLVQMAQHSAHTSRCRSSCHADEPGRSNDVDWERR